MRSLLIIVLLGCSLSTGLANSYQKAAAEIAAIADRLPRKTIAVLPLDPVGTDKKNALFATEKLIHEIVSLKKLTVVERSKISKLIQEKELTTTGLLDADALSRMSKILSVDAVIVGSYRVTSSGHELLVRAVSTRDGSILVSVSQSSRRPGRKTSTTSTRNIQKHVITGKASDNRGVLDDEDEPRVRLQQIQVVPFGKKSLYFIGLAENRGTVEAGKPVIRFNLLDAKGSLLEVVSAFCARPLQPGETLPFKGFLKTKPRGYKSHTISYRPGSRLFDNYIHELKASQVRFSVKRFGQTRHYVFTGMLENINNHTVTYPRVIISLYNRKGRFVGSGNAFATDKRLKPGQTTTFKATIYPYSLSGKPKTYQLNFSGLWAK